MLGMHRSGTSAITRSLTTMGISLGDRLMHPIQGNNDKGLWEDVDVNALHIDIQNFLDSDRHYLSALPTVDIEKLEGAGFITRASVLLRRKLDSFHNFGLKDPRVTKLLPFWKVVFESLGCQVSYVIAIRNPTSVVASLKRRDGIPTEKSLCLWLEHTLLSLSLTRLDKPIVVDYDRLIASPRGELFRMSQHLGLSLNETFINEYIDGFLDETLQHSQVRNDAVAEGDDFESLVKRAYRLALRAASDETDVAEESFSVEVERLFSDYKKFSYFSSIIDKQTSDITRLPTTVNERESLVSSLTDQVASLADQVASLNGEKAALKAETDALKAETDALKAETDQIRRQIHLLETSNSWRLTAPCRRLFGILSHLANILDSGFYRTRMTRRRAINHATKWVRFERLGKSSFISEPKVVSVKPSIGVILPIYRNVDLTKKCIESALDGIRSVVGARIFLINDASPESGMREMLEEFKRNWSTVIELKTNSKNLGFVASVNFGLNHFRDCDVVLLNSDVLLPEDWLSRLQSEAYSVSNAGTVTPLSNNATICSFPIFLKENSPVFGLDVNSIDLSFRGTSLACVEAPTGVGMCLYIRRDCLDLIGALNVEKFGRGYGEENDLCQRALKNGWVNLISPNIYVHHVGEVSFGEAKAQLVEKGTKTIDELHPSYYHDVQSFISKDPLRTSRIIRFLQVLAALRRPKVLHIYHNKGGGVQQHIEELCDHLQEESAHMFITPCVEHVSIKLKFHALGNSDYLIFSENEYSYLISTLRSIGVSLIHFHHILNNPSFVKHLPNDLDVPYRLTVHDFYLISANPTLTNSDGIFVGPHVTPKSSLFPLPLGMSATEWRTEYRWLVEGAECIIYPSRSAKNIFHDFYRIDNYIISSHLETKRRTSVMVKPLVPKARHVIGIIGAIGKEKGADRLEAFAAAAARKGSNFQFFIIGYAYQPLLGILSTGPFDQKDTQSLISEHSIDILLYPSVCSETYSYALSYGLESGLPIVAADIGAFPERLAGRESTLLYDPLVPALEFTVMLEGFISSLLKETHSTIESGTKESSHCFYTKDYLRTIPSPDTSNIPPYILDFEFLKDRLATKTEVSFTVGEFALRHLWFISTHRLARPVTKIIPYKLRRGVKTFLTRRPLRDIIN